MSTNGSVIALIDCDSFFASCEQLYDPSLRGKPVCVMSNNNGCVVARSKEAKELGVTMGMPVFQAKKLYPNVYYISGNLSRYADISSRIMLRLKDFSPLTQVYSIDEAFIDLTGLRKLYRKSYYDIAVDIRHTIAEEIGVPVSIGISTSKTLAKLATERAKKNSGIYQIGYSRVADELKATNANEVWGIGYNTAALLKKYGINSAYEFVLQNDAWIQKLLGKRGLELKHELLGECRSPVDNTEILPKSIQKTSSFAKATNDPQYIKSSLHYHVHRACKKMRGLGLRTKAVGVMLRTKDFQVFYNKVALTSATDWEFEIYEAVDRLFSQMFSPWFVYRSSGVTLENLHQEVQLSLFNSQENQQKHSKLAHTWDKLEHKFGRNAITLGGFILEKE